MLVEDKIIQILLHKDQKDKEKDVVLGLSESGRVYIYDLSTWFKTGGTVPFAPYRIDWREIVDSPERILERIQNTKIVKKIKKKVSKDRLLWVEV